MPSDDFRRGVSQPRLDSGADIGDFRIRVKGVDNVIYVLYQIAIPFLALAQRLPLLLQASEEKIVGPHQPCLYNSLVDKIERDDLEKVADHVGRGVSVCVLREGQLGSYGHYDGCHQQP